MGCHGIVCNSNLVYLKARSGVFNTYTTMSASDSDTTQVLDFDLDVDMHHAWIPGANDMDTDSITSSNDTQVFGLSADEMDLSTVTDWV